MAAARARRLALSSLACADAIATNGSLLWNERTVPAAPVADCGYYPGRLTPDDVKRRIEREVTLRKVFDPERFVGRPMLARWDDGVWYAVQGKEVVVGARRVVLDYVESGDTEEMSYRAFCKVCKEMKKSCG